MRPETPETDALVASINSDAHDFAEMTWLARRLERERDEAQERECAAIESWWEEYQRALREGQRVVELREENAKLRDIAEMLYELSMKNDVKWSFEVDGDSLAKLRAELDQLKEGGK